MTISEFDLCGPLPPQGVTVLEASAGTGKTYAITGLAARYVAAGTPLERVLIVTFTRMATGELRERVRRRLLEVEQGLRTGAPDPVVQLLSQGEPDEVQQRRRRLRRALAAFDAATIATTHAFFQAALEGLGIAADLEPEPELVEDLTDLVSEVLDDLYVRRYLRETPPAELRRGRAMEIARSSIENLDAELVPAEDGLAATRFRLAERARLELDARKRQRAVMSYDDVLTRLRDALGGERAAETAAALGQQFDVVLIDEFQDTDPVQWEIVDKAFAQTGATLVLVADPKQAIYSFRGADVYAYLDAAAGARHRTLAVNWRSDQRLLDAFDALFGDARLGHPGIPYRRARAAPAGQAQRLRGAPDCAPLRIRLARRDDVVLTPRGFAEAPSARELIARDLAADVVGLLDSGAEVRLGPEAKWARVSPAHLAVLVPRNSHADQVQGALHDAGVPAVVGGAGSVFATPAAEAWLRLLEALERPASVARAHAVALTDWFGHSPTDVAAASEADWDGLHRRLHALARVQRQSGVAALQEQLVRSAGLPARLLAYEGGERRLTDLRHVGQLLHTAAHQEALGGAALTGWLRQRMADARDDNADSERSRRLESDADAVQVLTIHRSKGLEFPVVLLPFLWSMGWLASEAPFCFHDPEQGHRRRLDVSLEGRDYARHRQQYVSEQRGEDLRLTYVALTRARHQAVVWWAPSASSHLSPLSRLVFAAREEGLVAQEAPRAPSDEQAAARFHQLAAFAPGCISVAPADGGPGLGRTWSPPLPAVPELEAARFERVLDRRWRRTSYSDLTAAAHLAAEAQVTSEPEVGALADEPEAATAVPEGPAPPESLRRPSLWGELPVGAAFGTLVHEVLQAADFTSPDLGGELERALAAAQARRAVDIGDSGALLAGLQAALHTPLGPVLEGLSLRDVERGDRLDELEFELPLAGGDRPHGQLTPGLLAAIIRRHLAADDPLRGYADALTPDALRAGVHGYLTGFLDLVVRLPGPRFAVLDYKTNWLGPPQSELLAWHYRPPALAQEMLRRHYLLQALLYAVALHRYLRWRLPGYNPTRHLAGVAYLFLRGMHGPDTPVVDGAACGVFGWAVPPALVSELSDALEAGA